MKQFPPLLASPPRGSVSPANIVTPTTLQKIVVVKPSCVPGSSKAADFDKLVEDPENLEINIEEVEEDSRSNDEWERFEKPAEQQCTSCGMVFPSQDELKIHVEEFHGSSWDAQSASSSPMVDRPYTCDHCDHTFKSRSDKRQHEMRHWRHKPFKCGLCDAQFLSEVDAKKHYAKVHPGKPPQIIENEVSELEQEFMPLQRKKRKWDKVPGKGSVSTDGTPEKSPEKAERTSSVSEDDYAQVFYPAVYKCAHCPRRGTSLKQLQIHTESNHRTKYVSNFTFKNEKVSFILVKIWSLPSFQGHH